MKNKIQNSEIFWLICVLAIVYFWIFLDNKNEEKIEQLKTPMLEVSHPIVSDPVEWSCFFLDDGKTPDQPIEVEKVYDWEIQQDELMPEFAKPQYQPKQVEKVETEKPQNQTRIVRKGFEDNEEIQNLVNYAYSLWGKDFLLTLEWENGLWKWNRKSTLVWSNGFSDYGLCQLNAKYHGKFIFANSVNLHAGFSENFKDPYKQIDYCWGVFQDGVKRGIIASTFYAYNTRHDKAQRYDNLP